MTIQEFDSDAFSCVNLFCCLFSLLCFGLCSQVFGYSCQLEYGKTDVIFKLAIYHSYFC